jgi:DNA repair protein SbcC/Rad50
MLLKSITLENIRSYKHQKIDFPSGPFILSGDIGSGKTSILLAIEFAFFGIMRAELSGDSLLRHGAAKGSVELTFEVEGKDHIIKRTLKRSKDSISQETGYIVAGGVKFEGTAVELKSRILGILGYPQELVTKSRSLIFRFTVYTPQEEMKQILYEDPELRLDTLRKLFGIDRYRTIKENSSIFMRELNKKHDELSVRLETYKTLQAEHADKKKRSDAMAAENQSLGIGMEDIKKELKDAKAGLEGLELLIRGQTEIAKEIEVYGKIVLSRQQMLSALDGRITKIKEETARLEEKSSKLGVTKHLPETEMEKNLAETTEKHSALVKSNSIASGSMK